MPMGVMPKDDPEKVIKSIEACLYQPEPKCDECEYECAAFVNIPEPMIDDAVKLLRRRRGTWLQYEDMWGNPDFYQCSACGQDLAAPDVSGLNYCPFCGARMEGVEERLEGEEG